MRTTLLIVSLLLIAACTQQPAPVNYRGNEFFGRGSSGSSQPYKTYSADSPKYKDEYVQSSTPAAAPSVGVSDLAPITSSELPPPSSGSSSSRGGLLQER